jgi:hypothetical protein
MVRIPFKRAQPPKPESTAARPNPKPALAADQRRRVIEYGSPDTEVQPPLGEEDRVDSRRLLPASADDGADAA